MLLRRKSVFGLLAHVPRPGADFDPLQVGPLQLDLDLAELAVAAARRG
jgi:hypothetical protein